MRSCICAVRAGRGGPGLGTVAVTLAVALWLAGSPAEASGLPGFEYVSPLPGSHEVSPWNNIALRRAGVLRETGPGTPGISVLASRSGAHVGTWTLSDDSRTLVFTPAAPFAPGETVTVKLESGPGTTELDRLPAVTFGFSIASHDQNPLPLPWAPLDDIEPASRNAASEIPAALAQVLAPQLCDTMPVGYLPATVVNSDNPDPGYIFLSPGTTGGSSGHLAILDNFGIPVFHRFLETGANDFTMQPNGLLTYYSSGRAKYYGLDSSYAVVDSFATGNGYRTDGHELLLLPNGHALLMAYDRQPVGMDTVVAGGNPNATVVGLIIQELDAAKNVVFQWRSWDHFQITDMVEVPGRLLTNATVDYSHGNAIEQDLDGNLLISSRHMNEITKIDRQTGDIIWRLGLNAKKNQFTFVNDSRGFSHQHDIRRLPNGHITVWDNGNFLVPQYSRAVEYALDEQNMIATQVWEFRNTPDNFGAATGSARRRANGATLLDWGLNAADPKITDLHADGSKALELGFGSTQIYSYRARRLPWRTNLFFPDADALEFGAVEVGSSASLPLVIHNNSASSLELTCFASSDPSVAVIEAVPLTVPAGGDVLVNVAFAPTAVGAVDARLYVRSVHGTELVAQVVQVSGSGVVLTGVDGAGDARDTWLTAQPNPGHGARTLAFGLPAAGPVTLEIYDLSGRRVATPFAGMAAAGTHEVAWTARLNGAPVNSGIYFARLKTSSGARTMRLVNLPR
jgi:hypothetical protein